MRKLQDCSDVAALSLILQSGKIIVLPQDQNPAAVLLYVENHSLGEWVQRRLLPMM